jgi:endonuclease/exonuclease/phosphatase family metal-dependent hydrolase
MKLHRFWLNLFVCVPLLCGGCSGGGRSLGDRPIRIMTYNIHHGEGTDQLIEIRRIAAVIKEADADIVALQEVDRLTSRSANIDMITKLADLTGMTYAFGKTIDFQGGEYGNGVLTRFPILQEKNVSYQLPSREPRALMQLVLDIRGTEILLMNTHLDEAGPDSARTVNAEEIVAAAQDYGSRPVVICGDFNDTTGSESIMAMRKGFEDCWKALNAAAGATYPSTGPRKRIDYIFVSKQLPGTDTKIPHVALRPVSARVLQSTASDHLPLVVDLHFASD